MPRFASAIDSPAIKTRTSQLLASSKNPFIPFRSYPSGHKAVVDFFACNRSPTSFGTTPLGETTHKATRITTVRLATTATTKRHGQSLLVESNSEVCFTFCFEETVVCRPRHCVVHDGGRTTDGDKHIALVTVVAQLLPSWLFSMSREATNAHHALCLERKVATTTQHTWHVPTHFQLFSIGTV